LEYITEKIICLLLGRYLGEILKLRLPLTDGVREWSLESAVTIIFNLGAYSIQKYFHEKSSHSRRPKQTFVKYASLVYEPGATKLSFFLQQRPQKGAVSVTECKM
jgi:hypothetical protein